MKDRPDTPVELKARALRHLARREHSRTELARKLAPHAQRAAALEVLLDALEAGKQLSDARYAEARAYQLARKYGAARIAHDLRAKGVSDEVIAAASASAEASDVQRAAAILRRKYRARVAAYDERARRARFLQSRGFSLEVIHEVLGNDSGVSSSDTE